MTCLMDNGIPPGLVRVSFGIASNFADAYAVLFLLLPLQKERNTKQ